MSRAGDTPPQDVRFCRSADGTRIAYAVHGSGPPLLLAACWLSHLEFDWQSPVWRHFLLDLGRVATVIRYDERGNGMSDWDVTDFGLEPRVADLEAVADAAGLDRFAMVGMSQGGPVGVAYAARHPGRRERAEEIMVLYPPDGYWRARPLPFEDMRWTAYGSSFLVGPVETQERPIVDLQEIVFEPQTRTFILKFKRGGEARVALKAVDQKRLTLDVDYSDAMPGARPFAALRSMYAMETMSDAAMVAWRSKRGKGWTRRG